MLDLDDTQPKHPTDLLESEAPADTSHLDETGPNRPVTPPSRPPAPPALPAEGGGFLGWVLAVGVMLAASCMCLAIIMLAGFAGVRDEVEAIQTQDRGTLQADVATQYFHANQNISDQNYELAWDRLSYIATRMPGYQDVAQRLEQLQLVLSYTPTPSSTPSPTLTPTEAVTAEGTEEPVAETAGTEAPEPNSLDPAYMFEQAELAMGMTVYENAIEWLDALRLLDPNYRSTEVQQMLLDSLVTQGSIYLRGQNQDGEERLMQGVQYIKRAEELGYQGEYLYEADFVERYMGARAYIAGGAVDQARAILQQLCQENCDWTYRGDPSISVRSLFQQVGGTP